MEKPFTDSAGRRWTVWMQQEQSSCAAAALYMAVSLYRNISLAGGEARYKAEMYRTGSKPTDFLFTVGNKSMDQLGEVLSKAGIKTNTNHVDPNGGELKKILLRASASKPVIANVAWYSGSGHQIVCVGMSKRFLVFLDPYYGLSEIDPATLPGYQPTARQSGRRTDGEFSGWYSQLL